MKHSSGYKNHEIVKTRVFQEAPKFIHRAGSDFSPLHWGGYLILMQTSSLHRKTVIFSGLKHSSGHKTQKIGKIRVFIDAPWLIYRVRVNYSPPYWVGYLMLMQTSSFHRKTEIFFGVKHSSGHKTQVIVKTRVYQEALWLIYRAVVDSIPPYLGEYTILMQTSSLHRKSAIFFGDEALVWL